MKGWVQLHRKSVESAVFKNPNLWQVWTYCLMRANHKSTKILFMGEETLLLPGQFITGRFEGSSDCNMKPSTFRDQLDKLKKMGNIDIKSDNKKSIISIVNWTIYQSEYDSPDISSDSSPTSARHRQQCNNETILLYDEIFNHWNRQNIIKHNSLNDKTISKLKSALKNHSAEQIKTAITNYAYILNSKEYYFNYKWSLSDFMARGIEKFLDLDIAKNNFRINSATTSPKDFNSTQHSNYESKVRMLL